MRRLVLFAMVMGILHTQGVMAFDLPKVDWGALGDQTLAIGNATITTTTETAVGAYEGASTIAVDVGGQVGSFAVQTWDQGSALAGRAWEDVGGRQQLDRMRLMAVAGWDAYRDDPKYWHDLGIVTTVSGVAGAGANLACAYLSSGAGPVVMATAGGACGAAGVNYASEAIPFLYDLAGWEVDPEAHRAGTNIAMGVGVIGTTLAVAASGGQPGAKEVIPAMRASMTVDRWLDRYSARGPAGLFPSHESGRGSSPGDQ